MSRKQKIVRTQSPVISTLPEQAAIRGITNDAGSNNCFLNCAVQALWNLDPFRSSFVLLNKHKCSESSCIFCALLILAANYQYHEQGPITPDILRHALAEKYESEDRFQIGFMEDAAECFESILSNLHDSLSEHSHDFCVSENCISHRLLSMTLIEQDKCKSCGATSEPLTFDQYVYYVSVTPVIETHLRDPSVTFAEVLKYTTQSEKSCPADESSPSCTGKALLNISMIEKPDVFCVGFAWPATEIEQSIIKNLVNCIECELDLDELFDNVASQQNNLYNLVGLMVYYGHHYFTFFYHSGVKKWLLYDDATVHEIGPNWNAVKSTLIKGRYQPLVLLYVDPKPEKAFNVDGKKTVKLAKKYKEQSKVHKNKHKNRLFCMVPGSPIESKNDHPRAARLQHQESIESQSGSSPEFSNEHKTFLNSMFTGVEERVADGLSFLGLKDGEKLNKKKYINDCIKQADNQYFEAKKLMITKDYIKALDFAIDAANFYYYIANHDDATQSQQERAKIKHETARIKSRRISRRISTVKLTMSQLNALYRKCPLCDNYREDDMRYCYDCTKYCNSCHKQLQLTDTDYCSACVPKYALSSGYGHTPSELVRYDMKPTSLQATAIQPSYSPPSTLQPTTLESTYWQSQLESPPPYETLRKAKCRVCKVDRIVNNNSNICYICSPDKA